MWEKLKELWAGLLLIAALGWILFHLILIKTQDAVRIYESNQIVLWVELVGTSLLIVLAIERFIKDCKR
ncbi:MAG TPA: hypothetical protein VMW45_03670 [Dehalococcoidia bacterium]|nr:hypothetical protein [Dehalococcoidia bacterium]